MLRRFKGTGVTLVRIVRRPMSKHPAMRPPLARTPLANPTEPWKKLFSMIGYTTAPSDPPEVTIPMAKARFREKCWETIAMPGT